MKAFDNSKTGALAIVALSALLLGACSPQPKTSSSASSYSVDEFGNTVKTTVTKEVQPAPERVSAPDRTSTLPPATIDSDLDAEDEVMVQREPDNVDVRPSNVRVRAPFVNVDSDEGRVHVRAPFVKIDKNGHGDRTTIRIPGITIRGD